MELAELEAKADDIFQNIKLSFGKDALLSFIKNLSQRHLGFEYVCDANQDDVVPDYSEMVPWGDTPTDVEMFYQDCSTNRDVQSLASVAGEVRQAEVCSTNHLRSDTLAGTDDFSARNEACNECSDLAVFSPPKKRIRMTGDSTVAHELIDKRANSNRAQKITVQPSEPCKPVKQLQHLYQDTIVSFLKLHWDHLTINGLFGATLRETIAFPNSTTHLPHEQQRGYHDILRAFGKSDSLHALRRVVAEIRSLQCYTKFLEEVQLRCGRKRGESAKILLTRNTFVKCSPTPQLRV
uniref:Uncharacterized protein n=1 Tax=Bionectria ochroleuca TaxID=29856 RepID=A0A8H7TTB2_BIOOC